MIEISLRNFRFSSRYKQKLNRKNIAHHFRGLTWKLRTIKKVWSSRLQHPLNAFSHSLTLNEKVSTSKNENNSPSKKPNLSLISTFNVITFVFSTPNSVGLQSKGVGPETFEFSTNALKNEEKIVFLRRTNN